MSRSTCIIVAAALATPATARTQSLRPVVSADFVVSGVGGQADSATVRRLLGRPDSIQASDHPYDAHAKLIDWWYSALRVSFNPPNSVSGVWILGRGPTTARGVSIGDSTARVRQLYGRPGSVVREENAWLYEDPSSDLRFIKIWFTRGRVQRIFLGTALD